MLPPQEVEMEMLLSPRLTSGKQWTISATDGTNTTDLITNIDSLLVGNKDLGLTKGSAPLSSAIISNAQKFTTTDGPYALEEIQYEIHTAAPDVSNEFTISIQGVDGSGNPRWYQTHHH